MISLLNISQRMTWRPEGRTVTAKPRPADDRLIYLVSMAQNRLLGRLRSALAAAGIRVTPAQSAILFLLKQADGRTMSELGRALSIENATITGLVDRLERDGFVRRSRSASDRRATKVSITPEGVAAASRARDVVKRVNESIKAGFSEAEVDAFRRILLKIVERAGEES